MTKTQIDQFNRMRDALLSISKGYQSPSQIKRNCEKMYGTEYLETLEMSYENIQQLAKRSIARTRRINN